MTCEDNQPNASPVAKLQAHVHELRGLLTQQRTPCPLEYKLVRRRRFKVDVVVDGRCLLYSCLPSQHAMLATTSEATDLAAHTVHR